MQFVICLAFDPFDDAIGRFRELQCFVVRNVEIVHSFVREVLYTLVIVVLAVLLVAIVRELLGEKFPIVMMVDRLKVVHRLDGLHRILAGPILQVAVNLLDRAHRCFAVMEIQ